MEKTITVTLPETWKDVSLKQYLAYTKALKPYEGLEQYNEMTLEKAINHLCNLKSEDLYSLPMEDYDYVTSYIKTLFEIGIQIPLTPKFKLEGTEYGFIPQLDNMTYGEYLDLVTYFKDMWPNMDTILSILYRPITGTRGENYSIKSYNGTDQEVVELFKENITMDIVWGAIGFFIRLQQDLVKGTLTSLERQMKKMAKNSHLSETLTRSGVDISQLQSLLITISQDLKQLQS
jgi:hypothetical protein